VVIDGRTRGTKIPRKASWRGGSTTPSVKHLVRGAAKKRVERVPKLVQQRLHLTTHMDTRHPVRAAPVKTRGPRITCIAMRSLTLKVKVHRPSFQLDIKASPNSHLSVREHRLPTPRAAARVHHQRHNGQLVAAGALGVAAVALDVAAALAVAVAAAAGAVGAE